MNRYDDPLFWAMLNDGVLELQEEDLLEIARRAREESLEPARRGRDHPSPDGLAQDQK
jgi:hypothetical protein